MARPERNLVIPLIAVGNVALIVIMLWLEHWKLTGELKFLLTIPSLAITFSIFGLIIDAIDFKHAEARYAESQRAYVYEIEQKRIVESDARKRAELLLLSKLNPEQRLSYTNYKRFNVVGQKSGDIYTIRCDIYSGNIIRKNKFTKARMAYYCIVHTDSFMPDEDMYLGQMLFLRTDETEFLRTAHRIE